MTAVQMLYAEGINSVNTTTTPQTVASLADTAFTASKKYLILAKAFIRTSSGSGNVECRLAHGTTPTVFDDNPVSAELTANTQESEWAFAVIFDQPSTREQIVLQFNRNAEFTGTVTCELGQILAINLTDVGAENTHWWQTVDLADYTTTGSKVSKASITFTANGADVYWALGYGIFSGVATNSNHLMDLNDSVAGVLSAVDVEGEDATNDKKAYLLSAPYVPSSASHTLSVRFSHESAALTVLQNAVYLINLTAVFAQVAYQYTAAQQQPAASPTWTTTATAALTPTATGNFMVFAHYDNDVGTLTDDVKTRIQHNNSGSFVSAPAYADSSPGADSWDATDILAYSMFNVLSLTSGASRTWNLDVSLVAGTTLRVQNRSIILVSVEKVAAGTQFNQSVSGGITPAGALTKQTQVPLTGAITPAGALVKNIQRAFTAALSFAGDLTGLKLVFKDVSGAITPSGELVKNVQRVFTAALSFAGTLVNQTQRAFTAALSFAGALIRQTQKILTGTLSFAGNLTGLKLIPISVSGAITPAGTLVKETARAFTAALSFAGTLVKEPQRAFAAALSFAGTLVKQTQKILSAALSFVGDLSSVFTPGGGNQYFQSISGAIAPAGELVKQTQRSLAASLSPLGELVKNAQRVFTAALSFAGALTGGKVTLASLTGAFTPAGSLTKQTQKILAGALSPTGAVIRDINRALVGAFSPVGTLERLTARAISGILSWIGALVGIITSTPGNPANAVAVLTEVGEPTGSLAATGEPAGVLNAMGEPKGTIT